MSEVGKSQLPEPLLATAQDWESSSDDTEARHCAAFETSKQVILLELTVPLEDCIEEVNERKRVKYEDLVEQCHRQGWAAEGLLVNPSTAILGITGANMRKTIKTATEAAEREYRWLWTKRNDLWVK